MDTVDQLADPYQKTLFDLVSVLEAGIEGETLILAGEKDDVAAVCALLGEANALFGTHLATGEGTKQ